MNDKTHWSQIYQSKLPGDVSWYQERPNISLDLIRATNVDTTAPIIDVGAGASTLVDFLLEASYSDLTLLDISPQALQIVRDRLGDRATNVQFFEGDVTQLELPERRYRIWHDRAVFHFLTDAASQERYIEQVRRSVVIGGHVIVATFAPDGPEQCSGLSVGRYDALSLHHVFGQDFTLVDSQSERHQTPWGSEQKFTYCYCRLKPHNDPTKE